MKTLLKLLKEIWLESSFSILMVHTNKELTDKVTKE